MGEVDAGAGFSAVAVATGDQQVAGFAGEFGDGAIFAAVAQAVELEGVHAVAEA